MRWVRVRHPLCNVRPGLQAIGRIPREILRSNGIVSYALGSQNRVPGGVDFSYVTSGMSCFTKPRQWGGAPALLDID